jgi:predicted nucleic acid-binding Zn ribbon protein
VARRDRGCGRGTGRRCGEGCGRKKKRRRKLLLCVSLLVWVLIALGIAVWVKRWGRNRGNVILPVPRRTVRVAIVGELLTLFFVFFSFRGVSVEEAGRG